MYQDREQWEEEVRRAGEDYGYGEDEIELALQYTDVFTPPDFVFTEGIPRDGIIDGFGIECEDEYRDEMQGDDWDEEDEDDDEEDEWDEDDDEEW